MIAQLKLYKFYSRDLCGIRSARVVKNVIDAAKMSPTDVLLLTLIHLCIYIPLSTNHTRTCKKQNSFILQEVFVFLYFQINISQTSQISTIWT